MELATGDLFDKIEADVGVSEDVAHFYFTQLISAVGYMHSKSVAHRDIKPENILLHDGNLKLADFGMAVLFAHKGQRKPCQTVCGSPPYMAPEVVPKDGFTGRKTAPYEGDVADIWSCGIVLFVLLVGNTPWDEPTMQSEEFKDYIDSGCSPSDELWAKIPLQAKSLLRGILRPDPNHRMSLEEVRRHPWFTRPNGYIGKDGRAANPIGLATQLLEKLHIDFKADPLASSQRQPRRANDEDAMDVDIDSNSSRLALSQPETPLHEVTFDWERPAPVSASQPMAGLGPNEARFAVDPTMSQFSVQPSVPLSLTQRAKRFHDIVPHQSMARFVSFMDFNLLLPLLQEALDRLAVSTRKENLVIVEEKGSATIQVKTRDQRNCQLLGLVLVERIDLEEELLEVRFQKLVGDPLEWRRLFKKVAVLCQDAIVRPELME